MRILRFAYQGKTYWGILKEGSVIVLADSPFNGIKSSRKIHFLSKVNPVRERNFLTVYADGGFELPLASSGNDRRLKSAAFSNGVKILSPAQPSKIILIGLNYRDHARELGMAIPGEPIIFLKPPTAVIADAENIIYPPQVKRLDYEAELALVIKKKARNIPAERVKNYILGYTCLNDITARDLQKKDKQWTRAKSFDTFCPVGPWIETDLDPANLRIKCRLNNKLKQDSCTANFIFPVNYLVSYISRIMTLLPGDIISTGTPAGVGPMRPGDRVEVEIEGIGKLSNRIISLAP